MSLPRLNIIIFELEGNEFSPLKIFEEFMKDKARVDSTKKKGEKIYIYEVKHEEKAKILLYSIGDLTKEYSICLYADAYVVLVDLENKETLRKLGMVINYIKTSCSYDVRTYILGTANNEEKKLNELNYEELSSFLNMKNFLYYYIEINNTNENINLSSAIRDLIKKVYENKKNQIDSNCQSEVDLELGNSRSRCIII